MKFLQSLIKSFFYAGRGLWFAIKNERNFRIELTAIFYVLVFALFYGTEGYETAILLLTCALVPALELINTAIENAVNAKTSEQTPYAKIAKDTAAAAVLFAATASVIIAFFVFSNEAKLAYAFRTIFTPPWVIILALTVVPAVLFIRLEPQKKENKTKKAAKPNTEQK